MGLIGGGAIGGSGSVSAGYVRQQVVPAVAYTAGVGPTVSGMGMTPYAAASRTVADVPAGTYEVSVCTTFTATVTGGQPGIAVQLGATQVPTGTIDGIPATANGRKSAIATSDLYTHPGGALVIAVSVRRSNGTGNLIPQQFKFTMRITAYP